MKLTQYQVDAFASQPFTGNPAAICPLSEWLSDELMQSIAAENNLAETAFFVAEGESFHIRWFTPTVEIPLCGHATLASAFILFNELGYEHDVISFNSQGGPLTVERKGDMLEMDFPNNIPAECDIPAGLEDALGVAVERCYFFQDYVVELASENMVKELTPDLIKLAKIDSLGVIVTAASQQYDFVNRYFGPNVGIDEDPVTGSAFTKLIPIWAEKLSKKTLTAKQVSARGGEVFCELDGDRVKIAGHAVLFMRGEIYV